MHNDERNDGAWDRRAHLEGRSSSCSLEEVGMSGVVCLYVAQTNEREEEQMARTFRSCFSLVSGAECIRLAELLSDEESVVCV